MIGETSSVHTGALSRQLVRRVGLISLIAILALAAGGAAGLWGTTQGLRWQLNDAGSTAARAIDEFLGGIEGDLLATSDMLATTENTDEVLRRTLDRHPAIFELILVSPRGQVLAQGRRVGLREEAVAEQPWLEAVEADEVYVGPVDYEEFGVPFVDLAVAVPDDTGDFWATLVARLDLTALWDTAIGLRVGETGYVYITDGAGRLLAYRDLQLVRSGVVLKDLVGLTPQEIAEPGFNIYKGVGGEAVVASSVPLNVVPWFAVIEQPVGEALRAFMRLVLVLVLSLLGEASLVYGIQVFTRRRIVSPLAVLRQGVDMLRQGNLEHRIDVQARDELGALADAFNAMAAQLQEMIGGLERRVAERTRGLEAASEVARATTSVLDPELLAQQVVGLARERFDLYYVGLFLVDEERRFAVLHAGTGEAGRRMLEQGHVLAVGGESMIGQCVARGEARIALDVGEEAVRFDNPLLPETRSEMALPLRSRGRVIGAMSVQSVEEAAFDEADIAVMQTMADQVAVAIDNARLFTEVQAALEEMEATQRRYLGQAWRGYASTGAVRGYRQTEAGMVPLGDEVLPEVQHAVTARRLVAWDGDGATGQEEAPPSALSTSSGQAMAVPILLRGQPIGALGLQGAEDGRPWSADEVALVEAISEQFAVAAENLRLFDETQRRAARERLTREITDNIRAAVTVEDAIQRAVQEIGRALGASQVVARIGAERDLLSRQGGGKGG